MKRLHPNTVWLFFIQYVLGIFFIAVFFSICFIPFFTSYFIEVAPAYPTIVYSFAELSTIGMLLLVCLCPLLISIALAYVFAKLSYNNYWYELKPDGFYKESGVITKKYVTIPYERIQNIDIYRGILARILGLSDLQIQTAGMSAGYGKGAYGIGSEGRLPGLSEEDATLVRDELIRRAKGAKENSGL